jgi:excisionase family DNA binding protein
MHVLHSVPKAAKVIGLPIMAVRQMIANHELTAIKIRNRYRIHSAAIDELLSRGLPTQPERKANAN